MQSSFDFCDGPKQPFSLPLQKGKVEYYEKWLHKHQADAYFSVFKSQLLWRQDAIQIFGKTLNIPRLQAWYGDPHCQYTYSGLSLSPNPFDQQLNQLRINLQEALKVLFNCVLCNWYRNGQDSISLHADDEPEFGSNPVIASISLGESRYFEIKSKHTKERHKIKLEHGSLLVMSGETQQHYLHGIGKDKYCVSDRINLTYRYISPDP